MQVAFRVQRSRSTALIDRFTLRDGALQTNFASAEVLLRVSYMMFSNECLCSHDHYRERLLCPQL